MDVVVTAAASDEVVMTDDRLMYEFRTLLRVSVVELLRLVDSGGESDRPLVEREMIVAREFRRKRGSSSWSTSVVGSAGVIFVI